nr:uncharacterized protein LOC124490284 [Dermatophagoides farinae]
MNNDGFTRRTIYILIIITWLSSALISLLFTYSSEVVAKEDIAYILHLFLLKNPDFSIPTNNNYDNNQTNNSYSNELNGQNPVASVDNHPHFQSSSSSSSSSLSPLNFDHKTMKRCRNPINENVKNFLLENFSIKADLLLTIIVFITQYFIPLAIVGYLYIEIGKIIHRQGKLCDDKGNARARIRQRKKFRRILMLIFMVAAFAICWLPLHIFHILTDAGWLQYNYRIFMVVHWIAMSSVSYNPFIYCWLNKNFRKTAMKILCCGATECCCGLILLLKRRRSGAELNVNHSVFSKECPQYKLAIERYHNLIDYGY